MRAVIHFAGYAVHILVKEHGSHVGRAPVTVYKVHHRVCNACGGARVYRSLFACVHAQYSDDGYTVSDVGNISLLRIGKLIVRAFGRRDLILVAAYTRERLTGIGLERHPSVAGNGRIAHYDRDYR